MPDPTPAKIVRVMISENDRYRGRPLYEAIVDQCRELKIAGATVFRGIEGYGTTAAIHRPAVLTHHLPIIVTIVDTAENVDRLLPALEHMVDKGLIAVSDVEILRIQKSVPQPQMPQ